MEGISVQLQIIAGIAVVGALVESFFPGLISEKLKNDLSALTIAMIGLLLSFVMLMLLLKIRIREGFEDADILTKWTSVLSSNQTEQICALYTEIYEKIVIVEKGAPPGEQKTDAQAREVVDKKFADRMTTSPISCPLVDEIKGATTLDTLFLLLPKIPDTLLIQNYETATACRSLLIDNYLQVQDAEKKRKEGFEDKGLCSDEFAKERKEFLERKPLSEGAQKCLLVEEIPGEKKKETLEKKLNTVVSSFELFKTQKSIKDSIPKVLEDCQYYKQKLDEKKKEAEALSNKFNS